MRRPDSLALPERAVQTLRAWGGRMVAPSARARGRRWRPRALELGLLTVAVWAAAHVIYLTAYGGRVRNGDVLEYQRYAIQFWTQQPLFHHLPVEYPPLTIIPFTLTVIPPLPDPVVVFAWWMAALLIAGYLWLRRYASRGRAVTYAAYLLLGAASTVLARYDLFPALVTLLALWAAQRRRFDLAYVLLAVGILLKLYPAFLVPLVAVEQWRVLQARSASGRDDRTQGVGETEKQGGHREHGGDERRAEQRGRRQRPLTHAGASHQDAGWGRTKERWGAGAIRETLVRAARQPEVRQVARGLGLCAGIVALVFVIALLLSPAGAFSGFSYAGSRPLQIESTPASLLWLGTFVGFPAHAIYSFHSLNYVGPLDRVLEPLSALALAAGCLLIYWRLLRGRLDLGRAFVACLCVVLLANKIFSPQYLIWILPLVAYVEGFDVVWLVIGLLTTFIYPFVYFAHTHILLVAPDPWFLPALALRNALLLAVTVRAVRGYQPGTMRQAVSLWQAYAKRAIGDARAD